MEDNPSKYEMRNAGHIEDEIRLLLETVNAARQIKSGFTDSNTGGDLPRFQDLLLFRFLDLRNDEKEQYRRNLYSLSA
jgi:hypothetical protein